MGGRRKRRHVLMAELCEQASSLLGPRFAVEAAGGRSIVTTLDGGRGGTMFTLVAPLPRATTRGDLLAAARNVALQIHGDVTTEPFARACVLGTVEPDVRRVGEVVHITFFDEAGRPLPSIQARISPNHCIHQ